MGPEASSQFPRASVAMQPHIATSLLHPHSQEGVLQLLAGEEVKEEMGSRNRLAETHYTLPSQSNPFTANPKEVVFVERRGKQKKKGLTYCSQSTGLFAADRFSRKEFQGKSVILKC